MKNILWCLLLVSNISLAQNFIREFPMGPIPQLTPGALCTQPTRYRYPENIAYCERDVSYEEKVLVFNAYRRLGFRLNATDRSSYKIDHFIPLCAGGSNIKENLWPQHASISNITDSIEQLGCDKMAAGRVSQARFVALIRLVKNNLNQAQAVISELSRL